MTGRRLSADKDMVLIWSLNCAELRVLKTAHDCDTCPERKRCERWADNLIGKMMDSKFKRR